MSKLRLHGTSSGYVEIAPAATASNNTLTAPSTVGEIIAKDAAGAIGITSMKASNVNVGAAVTISESGIEASGIGITCANINGTQIGGRRNLIINGAMLVAQHGTSSTDQLYSTVDRIRAARSGVDEQPTFKQITLTGSEPGPYEEGHRKAFQVVNGNQTSGAGSDDTISFQTRLEAQDMANSGWDYKNPNSFITLQFWVRSSVSQNFYVRLFTSDGTAKNYPMETGTLTADTWKKVIKTIPGHADLQFDNDVNRGFNVDFTVFRGTDQTGSGATLNQWSNVDDTAKIPDIASTWYTTNDATFFVTGLQLELGSQATPFEHRSFGEELALCQRYYDTSYAYGTAAGTGSMQAGAIYGRYSAEVTNRMDLGTRWATTMRTAPTVVAYSPSVGTAARVDDNGTGVGDGTDGVRTVSSYQQISPKGMGGIVITVASDNTCSYHYTADAEI